MIFGGGAQPQQAGSALNLSMSGAGMSQQNGLMYGGVQQPQGFGGNFGAGMAQQFGMQQPMAVAPPSETEILITLLNMNAPVERWLMSEGFQHYVQMISSMVDLSITRFFRNAKFILDDEKGEISLDVSSLPDELQSVSNENVLNEYNTVQSSANQKVQGNTMQQQQILALSQQSLMHSAFGAAMNDPGFIEKTGNVVGGFARSLIGLPPSTGVAPPMTPM